MYQLIQYFFKPFLSYVTVHIQKGLRAYVLLQAVKFQEIPHSW